MHVWSILEEVVAGKMSCRIVVLIGNDYLNDKKFQVRYFWVIIIKMDLFEVIKLCFLCM